MEILYLSIAGFNIKVTFGKTNIPAERTEFSHLISHFYQGFINHMRPPRVDYSITFIYSGSFEILERDKQVRFLLFYQEPRPKQIITYYYISLRQFAFILKQILLKLLKNKGFIVHASASQINDGAYVFTGRSGAGKSTVAKLLSPKHQVLADDSAIIKKEGGKFYLYQTPFIEKENWFTRSSKRFNISAIMFLKKEALFRIEKVSDKKLVVQRVAKQLWMEKIEDLSLQMKLLLAFISQFNNYYYLSFPKSRKLAEYFEEELN